MIRVIVDPDCLLDGESGSLVVGPEAYVAAYERVMVALSAKQDLTLCIQYSPSEQWFRQMALRYPSNAFQFETIDARRRLAELWGVPVPSSIPNSDIVAAGLLQVPISPRPGQEFDDVLLELYYDPLFAARTFKQSSLTPILRTYDPGKWASNAQSRLVRRAYETRLEEWKAAAHNSETRRLLQLLSSDPGDLKLKLMKYKVLRSYRKLGHKLLAGDFELFETLKLDLQQLGVDETALQDVVVQIDYILNAHEEPDSEPEALELVSGVSGYLMVEFDAVERMLATAPKLINPNILAAVEARFEALQARVERRIERLRSLIRPEKPQPPDPSWSVESMLEWVTRNYLPYQSWCDAHNQLDPELAKIADVFALWLHDNWQEIRANSGRMVFNILPSHAADLKRGNRVNLVLVIDNLPWGFGQELKGLFQQHRFYLSKAEPYLAMLPGKTEISKKCLLAGEPGYNHIDHKSYSGIIEKGWVPYFGESTFRYMSDPGKLVEIQTINDQTYVVNYLAVDAALHNSADKLGLPHPQHVRNLLAGLVEMVVEFIKRHDLEQRAVIHICSDHGSTRIPATMPNDLDPSYFKGQDFPDLTHRYTSVSNTRFAKLADNLREDCFFLASGDFDNPQHYLCARRSNRFQELEASFYVHGSLSPEEVVVPYMVFEAVRIPVQNLTVLLDRSQFRYVLEDIGLRLGNPNSSAVEAIQATILNSNVEAEPVRITLLNGKTDMSVKLKGRFRQTPNREDQEGLTLQISFVCHGEKHTQTTRLPISMLRMAEERAKGKSPFDDLD